MSNYKKNEFKEKVEVSDYPLTMLAKPSSGTTKKKNKN